MGDSYEQNVFSKHHYTVRLLKYWTPRGLLLPKWTFCSRLVFCLEKWINRVNLSSEICSIMKKSLLFQNLRSDLQNLFLPIEYGRLKLVKNLELTIHFYQRFCKKTWHKVFVGGAFLLDKLLHINVTHMWCFFSIYKMTDDMTPEIEDKLKNVIIFDFPKNNLEIFNSNSVSVRTGFLT